jgi:hypothetical protein
MAFRPPAEAPPPSLVAAWQALGMLDARMVPWWAAQWLADGHDGEALRELAGLNDRDVVAIDQLLGDALIDTGTAMPVNDRAAATTDFVEIARQLADHRLTELEVVKAVDEVALKVDYSDDVIELPLGQLYGIEDEWIGGWGRSEPELKAAIRQACDAQLLNAPTI